MLLSFWTHYFIKRLVRAGSFIIYIHQMSLVIGSINQASEQRSSIIVVWFLHVVNQPRRSFRQSCHGSKRRIVLVHRAIDWVGIDINKVDWCVPVAIPLVDRVLVLLGIVRYGVRKDVNWRFFADWYLIDKLPDGGEHRVGTTTASIRDYGRSV